MTRNNGKPSSSRDISDSEKDAKKLEPETTTLDLPDVDDIPGQENIVPAPMGELADTTAASADEEGEGILDEEDDNDESDSSVSSEEIEDLENSGTDSSDDENLRRAALDNVDNDGEPLNEGSFRSDVTASDLDVPGASEDDENEEIGEEDEENNEYSLGGDKHD